MISAGIPSDDLDALASDKLDPRHCESINQNMIQESE